MEKASYEDQLQKIIDLMSGRYRSKIELPKLSDPVFEEGKKEEKPQLPKGSKKDTKIEEEVK